MIDLKPLRVLLYQLDGSMPNVALMRIAAHHRRRGDAVDLRLRPRRIQAELFGEYERVYASAIFDKSRGLAADVVRTHPGAIIGGSGIDARVQLEDHGISTVDQDYSLWPSYQASIGYTQRGCRLRCRFCVVPRSEGAVRAVNTIHGLWRGDPWPRHVVLLDNDFFGQHLWRERIDELRGGSFRVAFSQGINARALTDEQAQAIASVDYRANDMRARRLYTAWDNVQEEAAFVAGVKRLLNAGVSPRHVLVYMLIGFAKGETHEQRDYRRRRLRELGLVPYPMPYLRTPELLGFQRWVRSALDKSVSWREWVAARYQPRNVKRRARALRLPTNCAGGVEVDV